MMRKDDDTDGPDINILNMKQAKSSTVRRSHSSKKMQSIVSTLFRKTEKLIVLPDQHRVPFLALYKVFKHPNMYVHGLFSHTH